MKLERLKDDGFEYVVRLRMSDYINAGRAKQICLDLFDDSYLDWLTFARVFVELFERCNGCPKRITRLIAKEEYKNRMHNKGNFCRLVIKSYVKTWNKFKDVKIDLSTPK